MKPPVVKDNPEAGRKSAEGPGDRQLKQRNPRPLLDSYAGANRIRFNRTSTWTQKSPCAISAGLHRHPVKQVSEETISLAGSCNPMRLPAPRLSRSERI